MRATVTQNGADYLDWLIPSLGPSGLPESAVSLSNLLPFAPHIMRIRVHPSNDDDRAYHFRFHMVGSHVDDWYQEPITGCWLHELELGDWGLHWLSEYEKVVERNEIRFGSVPIEWQDRKNLHVIYLLTPVLSAEHSVSEVLAHLHFHLGDMTDTVDKTLPDSSEKPCFIEFGGGSSELF